MRLNNQSRRCKVVMPYCFENHGTGYDLIFMLHEKLEHLKLARLQRNYFARAAHRLTYAVEFQISNLEN